MMDGKTKSVLTVIGTTGFNAGDKIVFTVPDNRWWKKIIHKILFMKPPVIKTVHTVSSVDSDTQMTIV